MPSFQAITRMALTTMAVMFVLNQSAPLLPMGVRRFIKGPNG